MDPLLKAFADMPPIKKKRHMVTVDGQSIEVTLQKKLEIMTTKYVCNMTRKRHATKKQNYQENDIIKKTMLLRKQYY